MITKSQRKKPQQSLEINPKHIQRFNTNNCKEIAERLITKFAQEASELGIAIVYKGGSLSVLSATINLELQTQNEKGEFVSTASNDFTFHAQSVGIKPEDLGKEFTIRGTKYKLTGIVPRRYKFPFTGNRVSDGRTFKFTEASVKTALGRI